MNGDEALSLCVNELNTRTEIVCYSISLTIVEQATALVPPHVTPAITANLNMNGELGFETSQGIQYK